jgi:Zn-finger nucleic acid-binding protein
MEKLEVEAGGATFHVDLCRDCGVYWFDRGEVALAEQMFTRVREDHTPEQAEREVRQAMAAMPLEDQAARLKLCAAVANGLARVLMTRVH